MDEFVVFCDGFLAAVALWEDDTLVAGLAVRLPFMLMVAAFCR